MQLGQQMTRVQDYQDWALNEELWRWAECHAFISFAAEPKAGEVSVIQLLDTFVATGLPR